MGNEQPLKIGEHVYIEGTIIHGFVHAPARKTCCVFDNVITITISSDQVYRVTRPTPPPILPRPPANATRLECNVYNANIDAWLENAIVYNDFMDGDDEIEQWMNDVNAACRWVRTHTQKEVVS